MHKSMGLDLSNAKLAWSRSGCHY
uniref:Uncharacterized protein n=1 Tax=Rhizophora mucronata TaxID=61149 RepID=A0A2P2NQ27_RHIMU